MSRLALPGWCRRSGFWFAAVGVWFAVLWVISSDTHEVPDVGFLIPHLDKILHFGYFFGGGGLLSAALYCLRPEAPPWGWILLAVVVMAAGVGWLDEWRQGFVPGRSGNDFGDWLADVCGGAFGALVFRKVHPVLGLARKKMKIAVEGA